MKQIDINRCGRVNCRTGLDRASSVSDTGVVLLLDEWINSLTEYAVVLTPA